MRKCDKCGKEFPNRGFATHEKFCKGKKPEMEAEMTTPEIAPEQSKQPEPKESEPEPESEPEEPVQSKSSLGTVFMILIGIVVLIGTGIILFIKGDTNNE